MLRTEQLHVVRHKALMEGQSQRRVARDMGLSRNTVKKYLGVSERKRIEVRPRSKSVLDRIKPRMDQLDQEARRKVDAAGKSVLERIKEELEERLTQALEAGQQAGGEAQDSTPHHSAALLVYGSDTFSRVDLRVDEHTAPVTELRRLLDIFAPKIDYFALRASDPEAAQTVKDEGI